MSTATFSFGRFNPPTSGHLMLAKRVIDVAKKSSGKAFIFTGQSTDSKRNPLDYNKKTKYMEKSFKGVEVVKDKKIKTLFDALDYLDKKGFDNIQMVVGSDRVSAFKTLVKKYMKDYNFTNFEVVSAGERDPDADGVKGMSASKMRAAASRNDYDAFLLGCPETLPKRDCLQMFKDLKSGMGIKEDTEINEECWFDHDEYTMFVERVVSLQTRKKMARVARKTAKRRAKSRKRKEKFRKSDDKLKTLANKKAKMVLRGKLTGGKNWSDMSIAARQKIDDQLQKKSAAVSKIAKKLYPAVKKQERERLQKLRSPEAEPTAESILGEVKIVDRLVSQLKAKGMDNDKAHAVARSQLQKHGILKKGSEELTDKGKKRNSMSAGERAKDRAAKKDGKSPADYKYNKKTNIATQKEETMKESDEKPLLKWMETFRTQLKKAGSSYTKVDPVDALKLYYRGVDPKKSASMLKGGKLDEAYTPKQKEAIAKVKQVLFRDNKIGFYTATGKIMVSGKDEKRAKEVLDKAFGGNFTKSTGMTVKKSIGPKRDFKINAGYESIEEKMTFEFGTKEQAAKFADQAVSQKLASVTDKFKSNYGDHMVELSGPHSAGAGSPTMAHKKLAQLMKKNGGKLHSTDEGPRMKKVFKENPEYDPEMGVMNIGEMSAKAHYKKYQNKFRVPPIDKNRYPNKEKQGLEGPYRSKKSGKVFYYDKKAGKYYDTDSDMYLQVSDVMESVIGECWASHVQQGYKLKNGKRVPNCVPKGQVSEATLQTVHVNTNRAGYRKLETMIASLDGYKESEFEKEGKAVFRFDAKKHDGAERKKVSEFIKKVKGATFSHSIKENLQEAPKDDRTQIAKQVKKFVKPYVTGRISVTSGKGKFPYIQVRAVGGEINNKLRKMVITKAMPKASVKNMDDISYGNVTKNYIAIGSGDWAKVMGIEEDMYDTSPVDPKKKMKDIKNPIKGYPYNEDTFKKKAMRDAQANHDPKIAALKKRIADIKAKLDAKKGAAASVATSSANLDSLKARHADARKRREEAEKKVKASQERLAALRAKLKKEDVDLDNLELEDRDYKKEYANFHGKPEQRAKRSKRVLARREMIKSGKAKKGDGKDVDHKDGNANNNSPSNLRMMSAAKNRSRNNNKQHEENGAGDEGTHKLLKQYKNTTPGESRKVKKKKVSPKNTGSEGY